jgi:hypothetical protein
MKTTRTRNLMAAALLFAQMGVAGKSTELQIRKE